MIAERTRSILIIGLLAAIPLEVVASLMLPYVPRIGVPRNLNSGLRLAGDISAFIHAPGLLLSDFLCVKLCVSRKALLPIEVLGGYLDLLLITLGTLTVLPISRQPPH
jgi:hypothetical protein